MDQVSVTKDQFMTSLRYLIVAGGSYLIGKGIINSDTFNAILEVATVLGPLAWGLYVNWQKSEQTKVIAAVGVQAGVNLVAAGQAVDQKGKTINALKPSVTLKPVTVESATQIVAKFGPAPGSIAKS